VRSADNEAIWDLSQRVLGLLSAVAGLTSEYENCAESTA
jgi:hypothetical protein